MKSFKSTFILVGVLGLFLSWYLLYEKKFKVTRNERVESEKQFILLKKDDIQEIAIETKKGMKDGATEYSKIELKKTGDSWSIISPVQDEAESSTVQSMLSTLATAKEERIVTDKPSDLESFGLLNPEIKISIRKDSSSPPEILLIGKQTPVGYGLYVKRASQEKIYRAGRSLRTTFEKDLKDIRNKNILNQVLRSDIAELEIDTGKEHFSIKKTEKENWTLTRENIPASTDSLNQSLNALIDLKAVNWASESSDKLEPYGLQRPRLKVWLTREKDKSRVGLSLGEAKGKFYVKRDDKRPIFEVDKAFLEKLGRSSQAYRSFELAPFNRFDIKRVRFELGKDSFELAKDALWSIPTEPTLQIDESKVDSLLTSLQDMKISRYGSKDPLSSSQLILRLFEKKDGLESEKVTLKFIGDSNSKEVRGERAGLPLTFWIKKEDFVKINHSKSDFVKKEEPKKEDVKKEEEKSSS